MTNEMRLLHVRSSGSNNAFDLPWSDPRVKMIGEYLTRFQARAVVPGMCVEFNIFKAAVQLWKVEHPDDVDVVALSTVDGPVASYEVQRDAPAPSPDSSTIVSGAPGLLEEDVNAAVSDFVNKIQYFDDCYKSGGTPVQGTRAPVPAVDVCTWEYMEYWSEIRKADMIGHLQELGACGWELVAAVPVVATTPHAELAVANDGMAIMILKRPSLWRDK
jgi:hypothetical protein